MTNERFEEIQENMKDHEDYYAYGGRYAAELIVYVKELKDYILKLMKDFEEK